MPFSKTFEGDSSGDDPYLGTNPFEQEVRPSKTIFPVMIEEYSPTKVPLRNSVLVTQ